MSLLLQTDHSAVRVITLNRPEKMNAYNVELHNALNKAILNADKDNNVRAIVITGAGKAFCAGADISQGFRGFPFARRGIVFDAASSWFLPRITGWGKAQELIVRGHIFGADEALSIGLVSEIVEPEQVLPRAMDIAKDIAENCSPTSTANNKRLLRASQLDTNPFGGGAMGAHMAESKMLNEAFVSADCLEGVKAFLEKRSPQFPPRKTED